MENGEIGAWNGGILMVSRLHSLLRIATVSFPGIFYNHKCRTDVERN